MPRTVLAVFDCSPTLNAEVSEASHPLAALERHKSLHFGSYLDPNNRDFKEPLYFRTLLPPVLPLSL